MPLIDSKRISAIATAASMAVLSLVSFAPARSEQSRGRSGVDADNAETFADTSLATTLVTGRAAASSLLTDKGIAYSGTTRERLARALDTEPILIVDLWASYCGPCFQIKPQIHQLQKEFAQQGVLLVELSPESVAELSDRKWRVNDTSGIVGVGGSKFTQAFQVDAFPTVLVFKGDRLVDKFVGSGLMPALTKTVTDLVAEEAAVAHRAAGSKAAGTGAAVNPLVIATDEGAIDERLAPLKRQFGAPILGPENIQRFSAILSDVQNSNEKIIAAGAARLVTELQKQPEVASIVLYEAVESLPRLFARLSSKDQITLVDLLKPLVEASLEGKIGAAGGNRSVGIASQDRARVYDFLGYVHRRGSTPEVKQAVRQFIPLLEKASATERSAISGAAAFVNLRELRGDFDRLGEDPHGGKTAYFAGGMDERQQGKHPNGKNLTALAKGIGTRDSVLTRVAIAGYLDQAQLPTSKPLNQQTRLVQERRTFLAYLMDHNFSEELLISNESTDAALKDELSTRLATHLSSLAQSTDPIFLDPLFRYQVYSTLIKVGVQNLSSEQSEKLLRTVNADLEAVDPRVSRSADHLRRLLVSAGSGHAVIAGTR